MNRQKKILILGAYNTEIEIINEAKKMNLYTIVTDNNLNWDNAPAKYVADEAWDISWSDIDTLYKKSKTLKIDGIMAGFSEKRIAFAQKLANKLKLPFYTNESSLDIICDKIRFKEKCIENEMVVPKSYESITEAICPVIIKPADNGGSKGISICYKNSELPNAYLLALENSIEKKVLIEEYIVSDEIMVYFTIHDGNIELSAMCDRIMHRFDNGLIQLPIAYLFPSKHLDIFKKYNLSKFKKLIKSLNIKNGLIAFQSFVRGHDVIPFDPTYRLDGTLAYHITEAVNGINVLKMLINYSIYGNMGNPEFISQNDTAEFNGKYALEIPILLTKGKVSKIKGLEQVANKKNVIHMFQKIYEGDVLDKDADFQQMLCRIQLVAESMEELRKDLIDIYNYIEVVDEQNENMIICRFKF